MKYHLNTAGGFRLGGGGGGGGGGGRGGSQCRLRLRCCIHYLSLQLCRLVSGRCFLEPREISAFIQLDLLQHKQKMFLCATSKCAEFIKPGKKTDRRLFHV